MPLMTNAEAFLYDFGIYATELWSMSEAQFLEWLNAKCDRERPADMVVRCKDCKYRDTIDCGMQFYGYDDDENLCRSDDWTRDDGFCYWGERKDV